jgi:hypothetical protein
MNLDEAKHFVSSHTNDRFPASTFGFAVKRITSKPYGVDWGIVPVVSLSFSSINMCHDSLTKNRLLYRLDNMGEVLSGNSLPYVVTVDGEMVINDGNHRIACLSMIGYNSFECRLLS